MAVQQLWFIVVVAGHVSHCVPGVDDLLMKAQCVRTVRRAWFGKISVSAGGGGLNQGAYTATKRLLVIGRAL